MQLCAALVVPSSNQRIETLSLPKSVFFTFVYGVNQSMRLPCSPPEALGIVDAGLIHLFVTGFVDMGALRPILRNRVQLFRHIFRPRKVVLHSGYIEHSRLASLVAANLGEKAACRQPDRKSYAFRRAIRLP